MDILDGSGLWLCTIPFDWCGLVQMSMVVNNVYASDILVPASLASSIAGDVYAAALDVPPSLVAAIVTDKVTAEIVKC